MTGKLHSPEHIDRWAGAQRRIGLTGGIASGKSSVGRFLKACKDVPIIDVDIYARNVLRPGTAATETVIRRYGPNVTNQSRTKHAEINRKALGSIIFTHISERLWLEKLLHPLITEQLKIAINAKKKEPTIVIIIPLLFEAKLTNLCSEIWVVDCKPEQQLKRLMTRDNLTSIEAKARIESQWPMEKKKQFADIIIDNSKGENAWQEKVRLLF